jgi:hypothetical protein
LRALPADAQKILEHLPDDVKNVAGPALRKKWDDGEIKTADELKLRLLILLNVSKAEFHFGDGDHLRLGPDWKGTEPKPGKGRDQDGTSGTVHAGACFRRGYGINAPSEASALAYCWRHYELRRERKGERKGDADR